MGPWPKFLQPQKSVRDELVGEKDFRKLAKVQSQGYMRTGEVKSLNQYSSVPKGDYIRMLYNVKSIGLNDSLWDPHFALTTVASTLREVEEGYYMEDRYIGEMFLKYMMGKEVRPFCGVDATKFRTEEDWEINRIGGW